MKDVQKQEDKRGISIDKVGIKNFIYPLQIKNFNNLTTTVTADLSLAVNLVAHQKGTHMSRFIEVLQSQPPLSINDSHDLLRRTTQALAAESAYFTADFTYFYQKTAPASGKTSLLDCKVSINSALSKNIYEHYVSISLPVTTLCPCSKEISSFGAHNQRAEISITYKPGTDFCLDDLIRMIENTASSPIFSLLKREDEKFVTEQAYNNPKFVEDIVRDIKINLRDVEYLSNYDIKVESFESIHNHNAFAEITFDSTSATEIAEEKITTNLNTAYIALGSNMGDKSYYIERAIEKMIEMDIFPVAKSSLILTKAYGFEEQDDFLNGVVKVRTLYNAKELLQILLNIEKELGRERKIHWGPRNIDLDIIYFENEIINTNNLIVPHPDMTNREFVLKPLVEIAPDYIHPLLKISNRNLLNLLETATPLDWLQKQAKSGIHLGLDTMKKLLNKLGNPQNQLKKIHVAGTNGKGSTSTYIASVLKQAGYNVGLFTSPHLLTVNESMQINGIMIKDEQLGEVINKIIPVVANLNEEGVFPTFFEILTALSFMYFAENKLDFAVIEVGLGGTTDATNIITDPIACVITKVDFDHTNFLGDTLTDIATHKAGIIKPDSRVFIYPNEPEIISVIKKQVDATNSMLQILHKDDVKNIANTPYGTTFTYADWENIELAMAGEHQAYNAALAVLTLNNLKAENLLEFTAEDLLFGLKKAKLPGRFEVKQNKPLIIFDGAHNHNGALALQNTIKSILNTGKYKRLLIGIGILTDKNYQNILAELLPLASKIILTEVPNERTLKLPELRKECAKYTDNILEHQDYREAFKLSLTEVDKDDILLWCGSLYLIGAIEKIESNL